MSHSESIEKRLLGNCLKDSEAARKAVELLQPQHFFLDSHQRIFRCIAQLVNTERQPDSILLLEELTRSGESQAVGGYAYLADLENIGMGRSAGKIPEYAERLRELWRLRELQVVASLIEADASQGQTQSFEICQRIANRLELLQAESASQERRQVFADYAEFVTAQDSRIDWMVAGIIERGANGFIAAEPKGSKSFCSADLAIALATGSQWLQFACPKPTKVALVSREDNPRLTSWRLKALQAGRSLSLMQLEYLEQNLYVNTRAQMPTLMLDNEREMSELIGAIKERSIEFVILDVMNVVHGSDENDNTQMAAVLRKVKRIQEKTGAAVGILHHFNKSEGGRITQRLRGASAIAGFAEWIIGLSMYEEQGKVRRMEFEIKAGAAPDPVFYTIDGDDTSLRLSRVFIQQAQTETRKSKGVN